MDRVADLLKDKSQNLTPEPVAMKTEQATLKSENTVLKSENTVLKSENASLKAQLQTQKDKYEQLSADFQCLAHANSHNVWRTGSLLGVTLLAVSQFGDLTNGIEAVNKYSRLLYTNGQQIVSYVSHLAPEHSDALPRQPHQRRDKWMIFSSTSGIQLNSIAPSLI